MDTKKDFIRYRRKANFKRHIKNLFTPFRFTVTGLLKLILLVRDIFKFN